MAFASAGKISSYLLRAKLYLLERRVGSEKCGKSRFEVCLDIEKTNTFMRTTPEESFKINQKLSCDFNCLIYVVTCKSCGKKYVGETSDEFRLRWNNHKINDRKNVRTQAYMQEYFFEQFKPEGHNYSVGNVFIAFMDATDAKDSKIVSIVWCKLLYRLLICYSYIFYCYIISPFVIIH